MIQFLNTLDQIRTCDCIGPIRGTIGHLRWQLRKLLGLFPCELTIGVSRIRVERPDGVAALVNAMGEYDYNNMEFLKLVLAQRPSTFADVGANIGSYTLIASEIPETKVFSMEPHPVTYALLQENVQLNRRGNVVCLNVAVSCKDSEVRLTDGEEPSLNHVLAADERVDREVCVPGRRLQTLCTELGIVPDFVKIDVEGHEHAVLDGLGNFKSAPRLIFIEGGDRPEIKEWMDESGYSGPWFAHFRERLLSRRPQRRPEDPIFVNRIYFSDLRRLDFNLAQGTVWP